MSPPLNTVAEIGTSCRFCERRSAVTTTSSRVSSASAAWIAGAARASATALATSSRDGMFLEACMTNSPVSDPAGSQCKRFHTGKGGRQGVWPGVYPNIAPASGSPSSPRMRVASAPACDPDRGLAARAMQSSNLARRRASSSGRAGQPSASSTSWRKPSPPRRWISSAPEVARSRPQSGRCRPVAAGSQRAQFGIAQRMGVETVERHRAAPEGQRDGEWQAELGFNRCRGRRLRCQWLGQHGLHAAALDDDVFDLLPGQSAAAIAAPAPLRWPHACRGSWARA